MPRVIHWWLTHLQGRGGRWSRPFMNSKFFSVMNFSCNFSSLVSFCCFSFSVCCRHNSMSRSGSLSAWLLALCQDDDIQAADSGDHWRGEGGGQADLDNSCTCNHHNGMPCEDIQTYIPQTKCHKSLQWFFDHAAKEENIVTIPVVVSTFENHHRRLLIKVIQSTTVVMPIWSIRCSILVYFQKRKNLNWELFRYLLSKKYEFSMSSVPMKFPPW